MALSSEQLNDVIEVLKRMTQLLGLDVEVTAAEGEREPVFRLTTDDPGRLIGRQGRTLDSIQYLLSRIMIQKHRDFPRIRLDVQGRDGVERKPRERQPAPGAETARRSERGPAPEERREERREERPEEFREERREERPEERREERPEERRERAEDQRPTRTERPAPAAPPARRAAPAAGAGTVDEKLQRLAVDAAKEVKRWGDHKIIGPFDAAECEIIHSTLAEDPMIVSESLEEDRNGRKKIRIKTAEASE